MRFGCRSKFTLWQQQVLLKYTKIYEKRHESQNWLRFWPRLYYEFIIGNSNRRWGNGELFYSFLLVTQREGHPTWLFEINFSRTTNDFPWWQCSSYCNNTIFPILHDCRKTRYKLFILPKLSRLFSKFAPVVFKINFVKKKNFKFYVNMFYTRYVISQR